MKLSEYISTEEKKEHYSYIKIDTKDVFDSHLKNLSKDNGNYIFRGVNEAKYKLYTSIQRNWICQGLGRHTTINRMVNSLILNIRKNTILDNYYKSLNVIPTDLLYLGLLQHYSAPSPLIDFSYSYKAALYFATKDINIAAEDNNICDYFSLYYIDINKCGENLVRMDDFLNDGLQNGQKLYEETSLRFPQYEIDKHLLDDIYEYTKWMKTDSLSDNGICSIKIMFIDNPLNFNAVITPYTHERLYWSNLNIVAQDGCFLLYNNENQPLEEYFNPDHGALPKISCIDIHKSLTEYIRAQYLQEQTESKLFPNMQQLVNNAYVSFQQEL